MVIAEIYQGDTFQKLSIMLEYKREKNPPSILKNAPLIEETDSVPMRQ